MVTGEAPRKDEIMTSEFMTIYTDAYILYGLLHAQYVQYTWQGLDKLLHKYYDEKVYGVCPRV
jgi:hypothetical protein